MSAVLRFSCIVVAAIAGSTTLAISAPPIPSSPGDDVSCAYRHTVRDFNLLSTLPEPLKNYTRDRIGPMADRGEFFNITDVVSDPSAPGRRFIRAAQSDDRWFIAFETGGIAYYKTILELVADPAAPATLKLAVRSTYTGELCEAVDGLLQSSWSPIPKPIH